MLKTLITILLVGLVGQPLLVLAKGSQGAGTSSRLYILSRSDDTAEVMASVARDRGFSPVITTNMKGLPGNGLLLEGNVASSSHDFGDGTSVFGGATVLHLQYVCAKTVDAILSEGSLDKPFHGYGPSGGIASALQQRTTGTVRELAIRLLQEHEPRRGKSEALCARLTGAK